MSKTETLISLVDTLSKAEKRSIALHSKMSSGEKDYLFLFDLACGGIYDKDELRSAFLKERPGASFDTVVKYLYKVILDRLVEIRMERDTDYSLIGRLMKVRVLFEKSLYNEGLAQLQKIEAQAARVENYQVVLMALALELETLTGLDFANLSEKQLVKRQVRLQETMRIVRNIQEHSALYELLRFRLSRKPHLPSDSLNDLIFSELNIVNKLSVEIFDISKNHLLFQANYFIGIGQPVNALKAFTELNDLFESKPHMLHNPPIYYLNVLEGILNSLRSIGRYDDMEYFLERLAGLSSNFESFQLEVQAVVFLYRIVTLLDHGRYEEALALKWTYEEPLIENLSRLNVNRQAEVILYVSLLHYLNGNVNAARKSISMIVVKGKDFTYLALYRAVRLVNLIYMYEAGEANLIRYESRSILRELREYAHPGSVEEFFIRFVNTALPATMSRRTALWDELRKSVPRFRRNNMDRKVLSIFDFISWIESKVKKRPMKEVVKLSINA